MRRKTKKRKNANPPKKKKRVEENYKEEIQKEEQTIRPGPSRPSRYTQYVTSSDRYSVHSGSRGSCESGGGTSRSSLAKSGSKDSKTTKLGASCPSNLGSTSCSASSSSSGSPRRRKLVHYIPRQKINPNAFTSGSQGESAVRPYDAIIDPHCLYMETPDVYRGVMRRMGRDLSPEMQIALRRREKWSKVQNRDYEQRLHDLRIYLREASRRGTGIRTETTSPLASSRGMLTYTRRSASPGGRACASASASWSSRSPSGRRRGGRGKSRGRGRSRSQGRMNGEGVGVGVGAGGDSGV